MPTESNVYVFLVYVNHELVGMSNVTGYVMELVKQFNYY